MFVNAVFMAPFNSSRLCLNVVWSLLTALTVFSATDFTGEMYPKMVSRSRCTCRLDGLQICTAADLSTADQLQTVLATTTLRNAWGTSSDDSKS